KVRQGNRGPGKSGTNRSFRWAHLDISTTPAGDSLSPRRRSGERVRERGFKRARQFGGTSPSPPPLSPPVPRREREQETTAMVGVSRFARGGLTLKFTLAIPCWHTEIAPH